MLTKELTTPERIAPRFIEPMYASLCRELADGGLWTYEAKLDGYRCWLRTAMVAPCCGLDAVMG